LEAVDLPEEAELRVLGESGRRVETRQHPGEIDGPRGVEAGRVEEGDVGQPDPLALAE
jgi:hypothetical protein